jgi:hypothetical protein
MKVTGIAGGKQPRFSIVNDCLTVVHSPMADAIQVVIRAQKNLAFTDHRTRKPAIP